MTNNTSTAIPAAATNLLDSSQPQPDPGKVREIRSADPFRTSAHDYLSKGWAGPIPLPPQEKFPPPIGWTGRNASYPDSAQVERWLARNDKDASGANGNRVSAYRPRANIGLHLGPVKIDGKAWEVVGIDSDNYKGKCGDAIISQLAEQLGQLPETWISSARVDGVSGIRYFLVPVGLAWRGNLSEVGDGVDIIQKVHRYAVVYPSWHPEGGQYLWYAPGRRPDGKPSHWYSSSLTAADHDANQKMTFTRREDPKIPYVDELAILPKKWVQYLTRGGLKDQGVPIDMDSPTEVVDQWAADYLHDEPEPCHKTERAVTRWVEQIQAEASSHDKITAAHWKVLSLALEGHHGWRDAIRQVEEAWLGSVGARGKRSQGSAVGEISRSREGALRKIKGKVDAASKPTTEGGVAVDGAGDQPMVPECSCFDETLVQYRDVTPPQEANSPDEYDTTDDGNAQHLHELFGDDLRYAAATKEWLRWDGEVWERSEFLARQCFTAVRDRQAAFAGQLRAAVAQLPEVGVDGNKNPEAAKLASLAKHWQKVADDSGSSPGARRALDSFVHRRGVPVTLTDYDNKPDLLGVANGMIELTVAGYTFRPAVRGDMVTYNTGVPYVPLADQKNDADLAEGLRLWDDYLDTFIPDLTLRRFVQKAMGSVLYGRNRERIFIVLHGESTTGKSTMLEVPMAAMGEYAGPIRLKMISGGKDLNPELIKALPRRMVTVSEAGQAQIDAETFKNMTGGDTVSGELKNSNAMVERVPAFTPVIATNSVPDVKGADGALRNRLMVIPFDVQISESEKDVTASERMQTHATTAVLAWLLEGWSMYAREGLPRSEWPASVRESTAEMAREIGELSGFVEEWVVRDPDGFASNPELRKAYQTWCAAEGLAESDRMSQDSFGRAFKRETGAKASRESVGGRQVRGFKGLRVRLVVTIPRPAGGTSG